MRSKVSLPPPASGNDGSNLPRSSMVLKIPSAGGQVPTHTLAPASARALAMANPKPPSSATPATNARLPRRSMFNMAADVTQDPPGVLAPSAGGSARPATAQQQVPIAVLTVGPLGAASAAHGAVQFGHSRAQPGGGHESRGVVLHGQRPAQAVA